MLGGFFWVLGFFCFVFFFGGGFGVCLSLLFNKTEEKVYVLLVITSLTWVE